VICGFEYWSDCEGAGKVYEEEAEAERGGLGGDADARIVDARIVDDDEDGWCGNAAADIGDVPGRFIDGTG
jgi:hypothetical protein